MTYVNSEPNFSIILPGGCNARCSFCFWEQRPGGNFLEGLGRAFRVLPPSFRTISITGGEPTLSRTLLAALLAIRIDQRKWDRVVITTNGAALQQHLESIALTCTHVNISRHGVSDRDNQRVFAVQSVPSTDELRSLIAQLAARGRPVTLSRVLDTVVRSETRTSIERYIRFAKRLGAASVHLRKQNGDLLPHLVEAEFAKYPAVDSSCPACSNRSQFICGMPVVWKRGLVETADVGRHEVVLQSDGALTWDWSGRLPYEPPAVSARKRLEVVSERSAGCGYSPPSRGC